MGSAEQGRGSSFQRDNNKIYPNLCFPFGHDKARRQGLRRGDNMVRCAARSEQDRISCSLFAFDFLFRQGV